MEMELGIQAGLVSIRVSNDEQGKNTEVYLITIIFLLMISLAGK